MSGDGYDTIVVGNGLIGSAAGRHLAEAGRTVAVIGPRHPVDPSTHDGVFSSHDDQGRLCSRIAQDPVWGPINLRAIDAYPHIEAESGLRFHHAVGVIRAVRLRDEERRELARWIEGVAAGRNLSIDHFEPGDRSWQPQAPMVHVPAGHDVIVDPAPAGVIDPYGLLLAQNTIARARGATIVERLVVGVRSTSTGVIVTTDDGVEHAADNVLVAGGAFTNFNGLLPEPLPLRYKTESTIRAPISAGEARRLEAMPAVGYDIDDPAIDDIYLAPPLRYPDGVDRLKLGCNTASESWPTTLEEIRTWFRHESVAPEQPAMAAALRSLLPGVELGPITSHRCIVTYTPSGYPIIDAAPGDPNGRVFVATGGNGTGAQGSDSLGLLAAGLVLDGRWPAWVERRPFLASHRWGDGRARTKAQARAGERAAADDRPT